MHLRTLRGTYLPFRYAAPLTAKLAKRYWELPYVEGKPREMAM